MDMVLIGGVVVGLVLGSFGYVLVRFWAQPLLAYRGIKQRLADLLNTANRDQDIPADISDRLRKMALDLQDMVDETLPLWYELSLKKKGEQPAEAVRHLQALANCKEPGAIHKRVAAVQDCLRLGG